MKKRHPVERIVSWIMESAFIAAWWCVRKTRKSDDSEEINALSAILTVVVVFGVFVWFVCWWTRNR